MFRLIRLAFFTGAAFVAGFLYAETSRSERCEARGGTVVEGLCLGVSQ